MTTENPNSPQKTSIVLNVPRQAVTRGVDSNQHQSKKQRERNIKDCLTALSFFLVKFTFVNGLGCFTKWFARLAFVERQKSIRNPAANVGEKCASVPQKRPDGLTLGLCRAGVPTMFCDRPPDALDSFRRLRPRTQSDVKPTPPAHHRGTLAARSAPGLRATSRSLREIA